jgi:membrane peptidoglycan carboxypeptidase
MEAEQIIEEISSYRGRKWDLESDGLTITTTLSLPLQQAAGEAFDEHLSKIRRGLTSNTAHHQGAGPEGDT